MARTSWFVLNPLYSLCPPMQPLALATTPTQTLYLPLSREVFPHHCSRHFLHMVVSLASPLKILLTSSRSSMIWSKTGRCFCFPGGFIIPLYGMNMDLHVCWINLSKLVNIPMPQSPHLKNGINDKTYFKYHMIDIKCYLRAIIKIVTIIINMIDLSHSWRINPGCP